MEALKSFRIILALTKFPVQKIRTEWLAHGFLISDNIVIIDSVTKSLCNSIHYDSTHITDLPF